MINRRYISGALLGAFVGFTGQLLGDFFCWGVGGPTNSTTYEYATTGGFDSDIAQVPPWQQHQARQLWYEAVLLLWLKERGDLASRTGIIVAFLSTSTILAAVHLRQRQERSNGSPTLKDCTDPSSNSNLNITAEANGALQQDMCPQPIASLTYEAETNSLNTELLRGDLLTNNKRPKSPSADHTQ